MTTITLAELHTLLKKSPEIIGPTKVVATGFLNRNINPLEGVLEYSSQLADNDELAETYAALANEIRRLIAQTDLADDSSIRNADKYEGLRSALWFATSGIDQPINDEELISGLIVNLLGDHMPGMDEYIENLQDVALLDELNLTYDKNLLVDVSVKTGFELRRHGLVLRDNCMVYPHQFMRRYYGLNFVDLPGVLQECINNGLIVKLRIDPLRSSTNPLYYREIGEKDYWHGKHFSTSLLASQDKKEVLTFHRSNDDDLDKSYPVKFTIFRSSMIHVQQRQFMVEEYSPLVNPRSPTTKPPGFGTMRCVQKFAHFVYDQREGIVNHIDGAVRTFSIEEYESVFRDVMIGRDPGSKVGSRHKMFLVEGRINLELAKNLLYEFFRYNSHVADYFSTSDNA